MSFNTLAYRIATEPNFAVEIVKDPILALHTSGLKLTDEEMSALQLMIAENPEKIFSTLLDMGDIDQEPWVPVGKVANEG